MDSDYFSSLFEQVTVQSLTAGSVVAFCLAALFLLFSAFVSASEVAYSSLSREMTESLKESKSIAEQKIHALVERSEYLSGALLIIKNFLYIAIVILCSYAVGRWIDFSSIPVIGLVLEIVVLVFLLLLFGEIMPKMYARRDPLKYARFAAPLLKMLEKMHRPLSGIMVSSGTLVDKMKGKKKYDLSVDELSKALELTSAEITEEKEMLAEIIKFYNKTADEIMTSRLDMEDIDIKSNFREVIDFIVQSGYSRIPVYADTEDNIKGILYIKDLLPYIDKPESFRWQSLIRPAYFVPETKKIDDLLEEFRTNKIHMAIVVDEFGGTSGIVTMEDILEEIVGDISDEYDEDEKPFIRLADGSYIFEGKTPLNDFFRAIDAEEEDFGKLTEDVETLAGLLLEIKGDFPQRREVINFGKYRFQILEMDNRRIQKIKFTLNAEPVPAEKV